MSDFKGHLHGGLVAAGILFICLLAIQIGFKPLSWFEVPLLPLLCLFGAFWPDSDIGSKSQTVVYMIFVILDVLLIFLLKYYKEAAILGLFAMLPAVSKHRGWTHNPLWVIVVGLPLLIPPVILGEAFLLDLQVYRYRNLIYFGVPYFLAFESGVFSHLALDKLAYFKRKRSKVPAKTESPDSPFSLSGMILKSLHLKKQPPPVRTRAGQKKKGKK